MAEIEDQAEAVAEQKTSEPTMIVLMTVIAVLTLLASGAGAVLGFMIPAPPPSVEESKQADKSSKEDTLKYSSGEVVMMLAPIVTNLVEPRGTYVRLEGAAVLDGPVGKDGEVLISRVTQDIMSVLHTMTLAQIEGPSGLLHLREDLTARARTRSDGKIKEIVLHSMVVE